MSAGNAQLSEDGESLPPVDTQITDKVFLDVGMCSTMFRSDRKMGDKTILCSEPNPTGRIVIGALTTPCSLKAHTAHPLANVAWFCKCTSASRPASILVLLMAWQRTSWQACKLKCMLHLSILNGWLSQHDSGLELKCWACCNRLVWEGCAHHRQELPVTGASAVTGWHHLPQGGHLPETILICSQVGTAACRRSLQSRSTMTWNTANQFNAA